MTSVETPMAKRVPTCLAIANEVNMQKDIAPKNVTSIDEGPEENRR
jgi:hypothetical protein